MTKLAVGCIKHKRRLLLLNVLPEFLFLDFKSGWTESDYDDSLVSEPRDFVRHRADQLLGQNKQSSLNGRGEAGGHGVHEEIEMKRQLWLKSCRADDNHKKTYGSAFVAPRCCSLTRYWRESEMKAKVFLTSFYNKLVNEHPLVQIQKPCYPVEAVPNCFSNQVKTPRTCWMT